MTHPPCTLCHTHPAIFSVEQTGRSQRLLCERCTQAELAGLDPIAARFFASWLPVRAGGSTVPDDLPDATACPGCGLTFAEFERTGLLGCANCYQAFEAAILPALRQLHAEGPSGG